MAEDYADRWCAHIEPLARKREPIVCSILPEGARRQEMGYGGIVEGSVEQDVYPTFYAAVATNTAYDIVTVMLDLYRITRRDRYREAARSMIAQFFEHGDAEGRPASRFAGGEWMVAHRRWIVSRRPDDPRDGLAAALRA